MNRLSARDLLEMIESDRFSEAKLVHKVFILFGGVYILFGLVDMVYASDRIVEFMILRGIYCIVPVSIYFLADRARSFRQTEFMATLHALVASGFITYMIFSTSGVDSPYYAGLNLVGIIALCFFTFSKKFFWITSGVIYLPYFFLTALTYQAVSYPSLVMNTAFMLGTLVTSACIHHFREYYRRATVQSRFALRQELADREEVIKAKTAEAVRLEGMSRQFSPQVLESIKSGGIEISDRVHRAKICAIFIDIVGSTERVTRIDKDKVHKVIAMFMEDSIKTLLKYDITVDKFLGDGILAFCNDPVQYPDYVHRTVSAALEIKEKIARRQFIYENYWLNELQIRVGIADGFANVGFYGSDKYFHAYTAIGPVVNLASRLCSAAEPNQILVSYDVLEQLDIEAFEWRLVGKKVLKGFEQDQIKTFEISAIKQKSTAPSDSPDCAKCGALMFLDTGDDGIYVFKCRSCGSVADEPLSFRKTA